MDQVVRAAIPYQYVPGDDVAAAMQPAPELCVVIPTFSERDNVPIVVDRLRQVLAGVAWEIIFVDDDSPDGTAAAVLAIAEQDRRVRCIRRIGRHGRSSAALEGMLASQAHYVAVVGAELNHDETLLAAMLKCIRKGEIDLVLASPLAENRSAKSERSGVSWPAGLVRRFLHRDLGDPLSGFFMVHRKTVERVARTLSTQGSHLLLDILMTAGRELRVAEIPAPARSGAHGGSRVEARMALEIFGLMLAKLTKDVISIRFVLFCLVGLSGVGVHLAALDLALIATLPFFLAQTVAIIVAMSWNFTLNNVVTYPDQRLRGWAYLAGLFRFAVICSIGAISNVGVATWIYSNDNTWWIAGLGGALMGAVWNYAVSAVFVWRSR